MCQLILQKIKTTFKSFLRLTYAHVSACLSQLRKVERGSGMLSPKRITKVSWSTPSKLLIEVQDGKTGSVILAEFNIAAFKAAKIDAPTGDIRSENAPDTPEVKDDEEVEPHD